MKDLINKLKAIKDNPDDLTELPNIIIGLEDKSSELDVAQDKIGQLHELNRKYLKMIPIKDELEEPEEVEPEITIEDAVASIMKEVN